MPTKIPWVINPDGTAGEALNLVTGCSPITRGCDNCYAHRIATTRLSGRCGYAKDEPFEVKVHPDRLRKIARWQKPRTALICSMGDICHDMVPNMFLLETLKTLEACNYVAKLTGDHPHNFVLLTKRADRWRALLEEWHKYWRMGSDEDDRPDLSNVIFGVSVEDQRTWDDRLSQLIELRSRGLIQRTMVSVEPLLDPIDTRLTLLQQIIDWVIVGCETGPDCRLCDIEHVRAIVEASVEAETPVFVKQVPLNGKPNHNPTQWSADLRRREFPEWMNIKSEGGE